jgi:CDP-2,3-bis-(O-geranylgeranyl)-sn-glycerol synthase
MLELVGSALWFILPAYVANATPVLAGGGRPLNGGKKFVDGQPLLGSGKTVRGFFAGLAAGSAVALIQGLLIGSCAWPLIGLMLALGALIGDLGGSFIKRRMRIPPGKPAPVLDQLDFVAGALILASPLAAPSWGELAVVIILTPALHLLANAAAHIAGFKEHPW